MSGKTILITGSTGGIGKETAIGLAKLGAHVVLTGRDMVRGQVAVADVKRRSGNPEVNLLQADLSTQRGVRQLAAAFGREYNQLHVLINNAGSIPPATRVLTEDGVQVSFAVNVVAPRLLTHLLLPLLHVSAPARVINLTGGMPSTRLDVNNLQGDKQWKSAMSMYNQDKLAMMVMSYEFAQRLDGTGVTLNVVYPGAANTDMTRNITSAQLPKVLGLLFPVLRFVMGNASAAKAARSSIYLASAREAGGMNGKYVNTKSEVTVTCPSCEYRSNRENHLVRC
jgi:NAD(P)-dependent dehydrogenase (short-subunit alcohol dehydrogenase family)